MIMRLRHYGAVAGAISAVAILSVAGWCVSRRNLELTPPAPSATQPAAKGGPGTAEATPPIVELSGSLLDQMQAPGGKQSSSPADSRSAPADQQLEEAYDAVAGLQRQIGATQAESAAAAKAGDRETAAQKLDLAASETPVLEKKLLSLQSDLALARAARPDDPIVQWLTGELLMLIGGEPEEVLPYFEQAERGGLKRPDALVSLARVRLEANRFEPAYEAASNALKLDEANPRVWEMFGGVALANGRFEEVIRRIDGTFPSARPEWADAIRRRAQTLQDHWAREQAMRRSEETTNNPRVRLTIEHQAYEQDVNDRSLTTTRSTGRDEVVLELFEDQAPATVGNFLDLVERGFYNGTRFHWAEAASMVVGGDPKTKNDDPADDGTGGPGYVIPDEFRLPGARLHFRGSVAMVASAAHTAGSQFFIELVPHPEMNHHLTVFGRVVSGQEGVDRITPGRTNQRFGRFGKNIPGDLLVRAEVIRKRPHPYRVIKEKPTAR